MSFYQPAFAVAILLALAAAPVLAQTYAPAPRAMTPTAPTMHPCLAPPQGQGATSLECKRECERNPQAVQCPRAGTAGVASMPSVTPNWGAPSSAVPGAPPTAAPVGAISPPSSAISPAAAPQLGDGSVRPVPRQDPMQATGGQSPAAVPATRAPVPGALGGSTAAGPAPVTATGGALPGFAPPGGVPVRAPAASASSAAFANAPARDEAPKLDRTAFDVDFGAVFSGEQVRRTVVLNASARGQAEFSLSIPNAPGFSIAEVRVMGQGASATAASKTQAPMPSGGGRLAPDSAVRSVASRATSAPWKVQFNGPAELQIDLVYAPTFDAFKNTAGPKMGVLNATTRNGAGASIALRAAFQGAALQPLVVPAERELVAIFGETFVALPVALTSTGQKGVAVVRLRSPHPGITALDVAAQLSPGQIARVALNLVLSLAPTPFTDEDLKRSIVAGRYPLTIEASGEGFRVELPIVLDVLNATQVPSTTRDCDGQIPAYFTLVADVSYDVGSRVARCIGNFSISQSTDWFRKAGSFDWALSIGSAQIASRAGWAYPGGEPVPQRRSFRASCGELTRDQYIRSYRQQDSWRLVCTPK